MIADVSIIVPTHNRAHLVSDAIRSLLDLRTQGLIPEVIVVNDGSTDGTAQVLQQFAQDIVIVESRHGERSKARNAGIARATAPLIGFLDDDDLCVPTGWSQLVARLDSDFALNFAYGRALFTDMVGTTLSYQSHPESLQPERLFFSLLALGPHFNPSTFVIKREHLRKVGGFDETINVWEDWDLWLRAAYAGTGSFVENICAHIRDPGWDQSTSHRWPEKLTVRAHYCLEDPYWGFLYRTVETEDLADFFEQLACDAFSHRLYTISRTAFHRLRALSPKAMRSPRRMSQFFLASAASRVVFKAGRPQ